LRRGAFEGISGTLKQKEWFLGLKETIWNLLKFLSFFSKQKLPFCTSIGGFSRLGKRGDVCRVIVCIRPRQEQMSVFHSCACTGAEGSLH
jgi:hypothetical protein